MLCYAAQCREMIGSENFSNDEHPNVRILKSTKLWSICNNLTLDQLELILNYCVNWEFH